MKAKDVISRLGLEPHPEGGHFRETYRHRPDDGSRGASTAIYFLLTRGEQSHWHRIDAAEMWHFYAGDPLELRTSSGSGQVVRRLLGPDLPAGQIPQLMVEPGHWQSARTLGDFTLVGCTVSPAFQFETFELAPKDFEP